MFALKPKKVRKNAQHLDHLSFIIESINVFAKIILHKFKKYNYVLLFRFIFPRVNAQLAHVYAALIRKIECNIWLVSVCEFVCI